MPGHNYAALAARLKSAGVPGATPCAVVSQATTAQQRTHLTTIAELFHAPRLTAPTLVIVGKVVRFADPVSLAPPFITPRITSGTAEDSIA